MCYPSKNPEFSSWYQSVCIHRSVRHRDSRINLSLKVLQAKKRQYHNHFSKTDCWWNLIYWQEVQLTSQNYTLLSSLVVTWSIYQMCSIYFQIGVNNKSLWSCIYAYVPWYLVWQKNTCYLWYYTKNNTYGCRTTVLSSGGMNGHFHQLQLLHKFPWLVCFIIDYYDLDTSDHSDQTKQNC